jgi:nicotinamide riboside kinase
MLFGLTGSSGTGKTTLAKRVAEELGITFMPTSITECAKRHGFDAVAPMTIQTRIALQMKLLEDHVSMVMDADRPLIVDRTPIDMIGYLLAEIDMHSNHRMLSEDIVAAEEYVDLCLETTAKLYDYIFVLGQLEHYEIKDSRPANNRAYQTHTQLIMQGALSRLWGRVNFSIVRQQELEIRHEYVHDAIVKRMDDISRERASSAHIH